MPSKTPAIISVVLTILLLIILAVLSVLIEMLATNGANESQGFTAMGISLGCQTIGLIVISIFAWWLTNLLISRFNWNKIVAVIVSVFSGTLLGSGISFLSIIIAVPVVGIK